MLYLKNPELAAEESDRQVRAAVASRISRIKGMEGHARAWDWRLRKYFPQQEWDFEVYDQAKY